MGTKVLQFHSDFASVTVNVNGVPVALHGEVDITIKKPAKVGAMDKRAWNQATQESSHHVSVEMIPASER